MNEPLLKTYGDIKRYEVYQDLDFPNVIDLPDDLKNELAFGVIEYQVCKCCCMWSEIDSLWGIIADNEEKALEFFKEYNQLTSQENKEVNNE